MIKKDYSFAQADIVESLNGADSLELSSNNPEMLVNFKFSWLTNESGIIPDFDIVNSDLLVCNSCGRKVISSLSAKVSFSEIKIENNPYYLCSYIPVLCNCINVKKSIIKKFSNGDIMEISSPVLLPNDYPNFFCLEDMPTIYFCSQKFKTAVSENNLTGLLFEECPIKSKSWF